MENGLTSKTKESVVESLAKQASPPLALMSTPPANPMSRQVISEQVWTGILMRFEGTLSERDKFLLHNPPPDPGKSPEHLNVMHKFDDFLLSQIGSRARYSFYVSTNCANSRLKRLEGRSQTFKVKLNLIASQCPAP